MAYLPPPYVPAQQVADPTNVLGRRISAYLIDIVLVAIIAFGVGLLLWFGSAKTYDSSTFADRLSYSAACKEAFVGTGSGPFFDDFSITPYRCNNPTDCEVVKFRESLPKSYSCVESGSQVKIATDDDTGSAVLAGFLVLLLIPLNLFLLQGITGATLGKHMLGLRVVRGDGRIAGFGWNALRSLMLFIPDQICGGVVGLITVSVTKPHRRVGDMAAGTYVVRKASVGTPITETISAPMYFQPQQQWSPPPAGAVPTATTPNWSSPAADQFPESSSGSSGWGAPAPQPQPAPQASSTPVSDPTQPQWDQARQAYIAWEPTRRRWMQHDATTDQWREI